MFQKNNVKVVVSNPKLLKRFNSNGPVYKFPVKLKIHHLKSCENKSANFVSYTGSQSSCNFSRADIRAQNPFSFY